MGVMRSGRCSGGAWVPIMIGSGEGGDGEGGDGEGGDGDDGDGGEDGDGDGGHCKV